MISATGLSRGHWTPRGVAVAFTDAEKPFVSEASVTRAALDKANQAVQDF